MRISYFLLSLHVSYTMVCVPISAFAQTFEEKRAVVLADKTKLLNPILGTEISLVGHGPLAWLVEMIQPVSLDQFGPFAGWELKGGFLNRSESWFKEIFQEPYRLDIRSFGPISFIKREGRIPDLLHYRWSKKEYDFSMLEGASGFLVEITAANGNPLVIRNAEEAEAFVRRVFVMQPKFRPREETNPVLPLKLLQNSKTPVYCPGGKMDEWSFFGGFWQDSLVLIAKEKSVIVLGAKVSRIYSMENGRMVGEGNLNEPMETFPNWLEDGMQRMEPSPFAPSP